MSKYEPFKQFLNRRSENELPLSFEDVEKTLGFALPKSAREYAPWWANDTGGGHVQAKAWLDAGWRTARVDLPAERIVFLRKAACVAPKFPVADATLSVALRALSPSAARLIGDYSAEMNGDTAAALARAVHEAAKARRARLIDQIVANAPRMPPGEPDSVALLREGREERDGR